MLGKNYKSLITGLLALLLSLSVLVACGSSNDEEETAAATGGSQEELTIKLGNLSDLTGPSSSAVQGSNDKALKDLVRYYNDENLTPGVKLEIIDYDTVLNPGKFIPGYEWLRERGADIIVTTLSPAAEVIKPLADSDGVILFSAAMTTPLVDPPGWTFGRHSLDAVFIYTLLEWIAENDPDFPQDRPAKIGTANWAAQTSEDFGNALEEYADAHPDQFEFVGAFFTSLGTPQWGTQVDALKDCDYIFPPHVGFSAPAFIKEFRNAGYTAKFIGNEAHVAFLDMLIPGAGWEAVDGMLIISAIRGWKENSVEVELAREVLERYHGTSEFEEDMQYGGQQYVGPFQGWFGVLEVIKEAVESVGAEKFSNQALYDTAVQFSTEVSGNGWTWTETKRTNWTGLGISKLDADSEQIVRIAPEWQPAITDLAQ